MSRLPAWRQSQQRQVAAEGCTEQPGGGSRPGYPGDGASEGKLVEAKYTEKPYFILTRAMLTKLRAAALVRGAEPVLRFEIWGQGTWRIERVQHQPQARVIFLKKSCRLSRTNLTPPSEPEPLLIYDGALGWWQVSKVG